MPPIQLVIKLGVVRSIQFLGIESHGFDVNEINPDGVAKLRNTQQSQWELYAVTQKGGPSEWLIYVTRGGVINNAMAMTCVPAQDAVIGCP